MDIKSQWKKLPPAKQRILAVSAIVAGVLAFIAVVQNEPEKELKYIAKRDQVSNVFTNSNTRNQSLDSLSGQLKNLRKQNEQILQRLDRIEATDVKADIRRAVGEVEQKLKVQKDAFHDLESRYQHWEKTAEKKLAEKERGQGEAERHTRRKPEQNEASSLPKTSEDSDSDSSLSTMNDQEEVFSVEPPARETRKNTTALKLSVMSEAPTERVSKRKRQSVSDSNMYIPAGSILTGIIMTGGEFPTNKGAFENPTPLLIRLSKDAILPNRYRSDVRECFLLAGGAGDLASERAKIRGETLSCVRHDGSVIETKLESYVAGEDGKAGIKGRLVSKQGQMIARSLVAGFAGGMSEAFDVNPVPVLATSTNGETQYQDALSGNAVRGAAVKGASKSLDRIAQFYLDMAEDMFPVVEVTAGREIDIVVISGTTLKISAKGSESNK